MLFGGWHPYNAGEERHGVSTHAPELGTGNLLPGIEKTKWHVAIIFLLKAEFEEFLFSIMASTWETVP